MPEKLLCNLKKILDDNISSEYSKFYPGYYEGQTKLGYIRRYNDQQG